MSRFALAAALTAALVSLSWMGCGGDNQGQTGGTGGTGATAGDGGTGNTAGNGGTAGTAGDGGTAGTAGAGGAPCDMGQVDCGGVCTDTDTDANNCGDCGVACGDGGMCDA